MPLTEYVNDMNKIINKESNKTNIFDPRITDSVIICHSIMDTYSKRKNKSNIPLPFQVIFKKKGEHSSTIFKFKDNLEQTEIDIIIDELNINDVSTEVTENGDLILEIEK